MPRIYKDQPLIELRHRDVKGPLRVRPIETLISIVGLALVVFGLIELDLRRTPGAR